MAKVTKAEYAEQLEKLRGWIKPGDTVYTILEHVSRSGMQRTIRVLVPYIRARCVRCDQQISPKPNGAPGDIGWIGLDGGDSCGDHFHEPEAATIAVDHLHPNYGVAVVTGHAQDRKHGDGIKIGGCGMDMGFALVYALSSRLYGGERCDCGRWHPATNTGEVPRVDRPEDTANWEWYYDADCPKCGGSGNVIGTGYQCLGRGKCPSNYHTNHRDRLQCEGVGDNRCYKPDRYSSRYPVPEGWPEIEIPIGGGETIRVPAACLLDAERDKPIGICPTCQGIGTVPNPEGPERFDLEHFDGYAVRHQWL